MGPVIPHPSCDVCFEWLPTFHGIIFAQRMAVLWKIKWKHFPSQQLLHLHYSLSLLDLHNQCLPLLNVGGSNSVGVWGWREFCLEVKPRPQGPADLETHRRSCSWRPQHLFSRTAAHGSTQEKAHRLGVKHELRFGPAYNWLYLLGWTLSLHWPYPPGRAFKVKWRTSTGPFRAEDDMYKPFPFSFTQTFCSGGGEGHRGPD